VKLGSVKPDAKADLRANPAALTDALRRYAAPFESHPPEIFAYFPNSTEPLFPFEASSDKGLGVLLLSAALYRPGGEAAAAHIIAGLYRAFKNDIFKLNRIPFESLKAEVEALGVIADEAERTRVPGILRSVCDFFYRVGPLGPWLQNAPDWEMRVMELCGEIYWMGRHSVMKNKARYFLWMAANAFASAGEQSKDFAWPVGEGHLRFYMDFVKPAWKKGSTSSGSAAGFDAEKRLKTFQALALSVFPEAPWKLFGPLDAYLRRGGALQYRCRTVQGGCRQCPLASGCPASAAFILSEINL
jgi:hypothetical protein